MKLFIKILCLLVIAVGVVNFFAVVIMNPISPVNGWKGVSLTITHPPMMAAMFYLMFTEWSPKMMFLGKAEERTRKEQEIRESGLAKASFSGAGKIGDLNFSGPLLKTTVYPAGIHFKLIFTPAFGVLTEEIKNVQVHDSFLKKGLEITHTSPEIASPIFLQRANNAAAVAALTAFTAQPSPFI